jgi:hypothetical protein
LTNSRKRSRNDEGDVKKQSQSSDDEEESRAAVMQKKVKIDPFGGGKKKKKNQSNGLPTPQNTPTSSQVQVSQDAGKGNDDMEIDVPHKAVLSATATQPATSPRKKKGKKISTTDTEVVAPSSPSSPGRESMPQSHTATRITGGGGTFPSATVELEAPPTPVKAAVLRMSEPLLYLSLTHVLHSN